MHTRSLLTLVVAAILTGCTSTHTVKLTEPAKHWKLGVAQTASGVFVVCEACPKKTPKTPYQLVKADTGTTSDVSAGIVTPADPSQNSKSNPGVNSGNPTSESNKSVQIDPSTLNTAGNSKPESTRDAQAAGNDRSTASTALLMTDKEISSHKTLLTLQFPFDVADLQPAHIGQIKRFAELEWPKLNSEVLLIVGHTDDIGTKNYNDSLARKRAVNVAQALYSHGIPSIEVEAYGKCCYVAGNDTKEGRAKNRRVEVKLYIQPKEKQQ